MRDIDNPRELRGEHRLIDVLAIAVCAVLADAESFEDIALYGRSGAGPVTLGVDERACR